MTTQPEALRLADILQHKLPSIECLEVAAAELRRLHAEVEALRADAERLDWCIDILFYSRPGDSYLVTDAGCGCCGDGKSFNEEISGRSAIDAARGEK